MCLNHGLGFEEGGVLGGDLFYDFTLVHRLSLGKREGNAYEAFRVVAEDKLLATIWKNRDGVLANIVVEDVYQETLTDILTGKSGDYSGKAGAASYWQSICVNRLLKLSEEARKIRFNNNAGERGEAQSEAQSLEEDNVLVEARRAYLLELIKKNIDAALRDLQPITVGNWTCDANQVRKIYARRLGVAWDRETVLIEQKAKRFKADCKGARVELNRLERATAVEEKVLGDILEKSVAVGANGAEVVGSVYTAVTKSILAAWIAAFRESRNTTWLEGLVGGRSEDARDFCKALEELKRIASSRTVNGGEFNEIFKTSLRTILEIGAKAEREKNGADRLRNEESVKEAALQAKRANLEKTRRQERDKSEKRRLTGELREIGDSLQECKQNGAYWSNASRKQETLSLLANIARNETYPCGNQIDCDCWSDVDYFETCRDFKTCGLLPTCEKFVKFKFNALLGVRKQAVKTRVEHVAQRIEEKIWKARIGLYWRKHLVDLWLNADPCVARFIGDAVRIWLECVDRIDRNTGEYPKS